MNKKSKIKELPLKEKVRYFPKIFPKKLITKRKGVRKNGLKKWLPGEIRDWDIE